jgi:hypothetical protein
MCVSSDNLGDDGESSKEGIIQVRETFGNILVDSQILGPGRRLRKLRILAVIISFR